MCSLEGKLVALVCSPHGPSQVSEILQKFENYLRMKSSLLNPPLSDFNPQLSWPSGNLSGPNNNIASTSWWFPSLISIVSYPDFSRRAMERLHSLVCDEAHVDWHILDTFNVMVLKGMQYHLPISIYLVLRKGTFFFNICSRFNVGEFNSYCSGIF